MSKFVLVGLVAYNFVEVQVDDDFLLNDDSKPAIYSKALDLAHNQPGEWQIDSFGELKIEEYPNESK